MRGPIDFIIVGFSGNKFDGSIVSALADALEKNIIGLIALALISKDNKGVVTVVDVSDSGDDIVVEILKKYPGDSTLVSQEDIDEMAELLENNTSAGLLVVEHLWAKPLKKAIIDANGVLIADGRIHPDAAEEIK
jgi:spore coat polysaccharide biosynthesis predicted glycosyltransferase SpsG